MTSVEQAKQWLESGFLDTLPELIEFEFNDGTKDLVFISCKPKSGIILNLQYLKRDLNAKAKADTLENITEIVGSVKHYLKYVGK